MSARAVLRIKGRKAMKSAAVERRLGPGRTTTLKIRLSKKLRSAADSALRSRQVRQGALRRDGHRHGLQPHDTHHRRATLRD